MRSVNSNKKEQDQETKGLVQEFLASGGKMSRLVSKKTRKKVFKPFKHYDRDDLDYIS
jgi:hypothetical protein